MRYMILIAAVFVFLAGLASATSQLVTFNGNFSNGTSLYSTGYDFTGNITSVNVTSRDSYPIRNCTSETICSSYNYTFNKRCVKYNNSSNVTCVKFMMTRIRDVCNKYAVVGKRCSSLKALCHNPYSPYTNQLSLTNFAYSADNGTSWNALPYKISFNNASLMFRINIPANCYPKYDVNDSIILFY